jgi:hypothetical protein
MKAKLENYYLAITYKTIACLLISIQFKHSGVKSKKKQFCLRNNFKPMNKIQISLFIFSRFKNKETIPVAETKNESYER